MICNNATTALVERLTRVPRVRKVDSLNLKGRPNLTQLCKRFATTSTSTQVAVLPWRYDAEMGKANSLHPSTMKRLYNERKGNNAALNFYVLKRRNYVSILNKTFHFIDL